jgi:hypothetical protein
VRLERGDRQRAVAPGRSSELVTVLRACFRVKAGAGASRWVAIDLSNLGMVVARNESGPRYTQEPSKEESLVLPGSVSVAPRPRDLLAACESKAEPA